MNRLGAGEIDELNFRFVTRSEVGWSTSHDGHPRLFAPGIGRHQTSRQDSGFGRCPSTIALSESTAIQLEAAVEFS